MDVGMRSLGVGGFYAVAQAPSASVRNQRRRLWWISDPEGSSTYLQLSFAVTTWFVSFISRMVAHFTISSDSYQHYDYLLQPLYGDEKALGDCSNGYFFL